MVLADTSVWVDYARRGAQGRAARLGPLLSDGEVATCGPVAAELLAGAKGETAERLGATLVSLPWVELSHVSWFRVAEVARRLRDKGQPLPLTDLAIAAAAVQDGHSLWSFDTDFERIATALPELTFFDAA